jgi:hypothetical protein
LADLIDPILGGVGTLGCKPWIESKRDQGKSKGTKEGDIRLVKRTIDENVLREDYDLPLVLLSAFLWRQRIAAERIFPFDGPVPLVDHEHGALLPADLEPPRLGILLRLEVFGGA